MKGLSVLTIVKNRTPHLLAQLEGLRRSAPPPDEYIVVNLSEAEISLGRTSFPIRMVHAPSKNLPLAHARNRAAAQARFDTLLFLDVDCIPMRDLVATVQAEMRHFKGLLCAEVFYLAADERRGGWTEEGLLRRAVRHTLRQFPVRGLKPETNAGLFWSLAFAIRQDCFWALDGFDERFCGYGAEDTDFSFRAKSHGLELAFLGGAGVFHQHHGVYDPPLQHFHDIVCNAGLFYRIHKTWPMAGWLAAFQRMGLILLERDSCHVLRPPSSREIAHARQPPMTRF